jgi:hypothetical protein
MKLAVVFGGHTGSVPAVIRQERENPQEIKNKQALFVVNLPGKKWWHICIIRDRHKPEAPVTLTLERPLWTAKTTLTG